MTAASGDHKTQFDKLVPLTPYGDIAEFGVYEGYSTLQLATYGRRVWAFDTFDGMPEQDYISQLDYDNPPHKFKSPDSLLPHLYSIPNIIPVAGRFEHVLGFIPSNIRFSFVFMDCDLYLSYKQVLNWLPTRLIKGAIVLFDDYQCCKGATLAVDNWMKEFELKFMPEQDAGWAIVWR